MKKLFLIPARGGSKGLLRKNILSLDGLPMIYYTLDAAKNAMSKDDVICVSTDDTEIIQKVNEWGLEVPFTRPKELASDISTTQEVIKHALDWYLERNIIFDLIVLLQPTSPLRNAEHINKALGLWNKDLDMVVSVKETDANPYYVLFEENESGFLEISKKGEFTRRQDCPKVYEYNGAIYLFSVNKFYSLGFAKFSKIRKFEMPAFYSVDIDDMADFLVAETYLKYLQRKN